MITHNRIYASSLSKDSRLNLQDTVLSGQSFRWNLSEILKSYYSTVINSSIIFVREINSDTLEVLCTDQELAGMPVNAFLKHFFSLDFQEETVFSSRFKEKFPQVWKLAHPYSSVRVMRQDPFEVMVTFMCAQGIGMHLIRRQVSMIAERYGQKIMLELPEGKMVFYGFPTPSALASADPNELAVCTNNNRIRAANIISIARSFESGKLALACVGSGQCDLETLRETLCVHSGIGLKIADCIALFGLGRFDAFPIDTHVKQYLWEWFGIEEARHSLTEKNYRVLQEKARAILGTEYAGYAGHILFHCWRKEVKKMKAF
ncbi:Fe-S cluster assembly protein HesB [Chlorobaculum sp. MV4-Y]|uniref:DNA-3-methyladenine glycosylase family protein n=1 Tax=Chlorobaculum sp. MV4-Y TaxID=2976335 RepID=UPI0021AEE5D0|nr:DNA glycosylase [Chlorobaculum sp. MV4-Y]UWX58470.1 Fe-S cluster assembly protein HesB [Chlorobaculum sp. MV4-Y]